MNKTFEEFVAALLSSYLVGECRSMPRESGSNGKLDSLDPVNAQSVDGYLLSSQPT
jgi:hypothetical protein